MLTKEKIIASIKAMPEDNFEDIDVLLERIVLLDKIEESETAIREGNVYTHKEAMEKMKKWLEVIWTRPALIDLRNITEYISKDSEYYASKLTKAIFELTGKLAIYPTKGKPVPELKPSDYKEILFKKYRIIYRVEPDIVFIISVHHSSRLLSNNNTFKDMIK